MRAAGEGSCKVACWVGLLVVDRVWCLVKVGVWAADFKLRLTFCLPVSGSCSLDTRLDFVPM